MPYLIEAEDDVMENKRYQLLSYPKYNYRFDFLASFMEIKLKKRQIYKVVTLKPVDFEYQFIRGAFEDTIGPQENENAMSKVKNILNISKPIQVKKIEKIFNRVTFEKFTREVRCML